MNVEMKLREGKGSIWGRVKRLARAALSWHIPVHPTTRPIFASLYRAHVLVREGCLWALRFFWFEPLFRSQCATVGRGLRMEQLPYLHGTGRITLGRGVRLSGKSSIGFCNHTSDRPELVIGDGSFVGHACSFGIAGSVRIGANCLLAGAVTIRDCDGHPVDAQRRMSGDRTTAEEIRPVVIEDGAWIGSGARILKGVRIGARSIVGAGAVVSRDVPPDCIVAGNPARIVKSLNREIAPMDWPSIPRTQTQLQPI